MKNLFALTLLSVVLLACSDKTRFKEVEVRDLYSIHVPEFLSETNDLNAEASLQYMNTAREFYVLVIHESKDEFHAAIKELELEDQYPLNIDGYAKVLIDNFKLNAEVKKQSDISEITIDKRAARMVNFDAVIEGVDAYCTMVYVDGKTNYYQIFAWTLQKYKDKYAEDLDAIATTFKEK